MSYREPARLPGRRARSTFLAVLVVVSAAFIAVLGFRSSTAASLIDVVRSERPGAVGEVDAPSSSTVASPPGLSRSERHGAPSSATANPIDIPPVPGDLGGLRREARDAVGEADGVVPDGTTVFDDEIPGVARLDPALLDALRRAATDAVDEGVHFVVHSGWRSTDYQRQRLREAVSQYGSEEEAARWVATAETSAHISGDAVDIGPSDATVWLSEHGAEYGLCQIYRNEPWHYELRSEAIDHGCPSMYADPTDDPRMQQ